MAYQEGSLGSDHRRAWQASDSDGFILHAGFCHVWILNLSWCKMQFYQLSTLQNALRKWAPTCPRVYLLAGRREKGECLPNGNSRLAGIFVCLPDLNQKKSSIKSLGHLGIETARGRGSYSNMPNTSIHGDSSYSPLPLRIIHLEDDAADAALIAWTLRTAGIQCRITRVVNEANYAAALRQGEMDLILSDSSVPGFSGLAALEMARAANISAPFIFVSGGVTPETRNEALQLGATEYLSKEHRIQLVFLAQQVWQNKAGG